MLVELLGSLSVLTGLLQDQVGRLSGTIPIGAIPVWDQYRDFLDWCLTHLGDLLGSGGLAIIAFTIIIKTLLLPLTVRSTRSSKAMQELAPKIKDIQKKYGKDRQRASQETMALYQQHGVNPMAGCLPMLLQIPIFFGLYHSISSLSNHGTGVFQNGFLWLDSLADPDPYKVLAILAGVFQFVQARMMRPAGQKVTDPQQQIMNTMMNFMPLMVVIFGWNFASGPVLYWVTQSLYSVVQQWLIGGWGSMGEWFPWLPELPAHRQLGYQDPSKRKNVVVVTGDGTAAAAQQKGVSGWLNRKMMEAQESAQEQQKLRAEKQKSAKESTSSASDEIVAETTAKRQSNYQSRTSGSKFGVSASATSSTNGETAKAARPATTSTPKKTGKTRTKPQRRPTS